MKTLTILGLVTILSLTGHAQQLINQKDAFSGKQIKAATIMLGGTFNNIGQMFGFAETDGKKYVSLIWMPSLSGADVGNFDFNTVDIKKCSILLKMDNDSVFRFKADTILSKKGGSGMGAVLSIGAEITDNQLKFLMTNKIDVIRLGLTSDYTGVDAPFLTERLRKQVEKCAAFMLNVKK
ncbi:hypothetical protein [Mucilaginibacter sp. L196]|uniref:hypothetical protein n=1 Tax=Mucilaginibacter sp. L196 TaxID=1641870 RepID=UPI00131CF1CD|nr:hypothetical protein [Mucilaginibacter sp. L196]